MYILTTNRFPTDVEIAARFVLDGKPNAALIEKAKAVYQTGFSKFPRSPTVMQAYLSHACFTCDVFIYWN